MIDGWRAVSQVDGGMGKGIEMVRGHCVGALVLAFIIGTGLEARSDEGPNKEPNPRELLEGVAKAREQISSGEMELEWFSYWFDRPLDGTNHVKLKVVFDGSNRRFESIGREYTYTLMGPGAGEVTDAKRAELALDREATVRAGLLEGFEARYVTSYDGSVLLRYRETNGRPDGTTMNDPAKGSYTFIFDPRCLGLRTYLFVGWTVENCLGYRDAKSIELAGKESVNGTAAWHVRVKSKYDESLDFWIDANHPRRLIKHTYGMDTVVSEFDETDANGVIPTGCQVSEYRNGKQRDYYRFVRGKSRFNVAVDPAWWGLAGLKMPIGTSVQDDRISRHLGYWDGERISKNNAVRFGSWREKPDVAKILALAQKDSKSDFGQVAATWIILYAPDTAAVQDAADIIEREHVQSTNLVYLCQGLAKGRNGTTKLLRAILDRNGSRGVQAHTCFALANQLTRQADESGDREAAAESARLYERVIRDYGEVPAEDKTLGEQARAELNAPRVGAAAAEIEGEDIEGVKFKLSDYRGKVVVLDFWGDW